MKRKRINIIDELRGFLLILMIIYHFFYALALIYKFKEARPLFMEINKWQPLLPFGFVILSGISFNLSRDNLRRGFKLAAVAFMMTAVLAVFMPSQIIRFGIIHMLAFAHILCALLKRVIDKIPTAAGALASLALFAFTYNVQWGSVGFGGFSARLPEPLYESDVLMVLGFRSESFFSADYLPLLPWLFAFTAGIFIGRLTKKLPESLCRKHIPPLAFIGRHSLIIYLVHQPIIIGAIGLFSGIDIFGKL